MHTHCVGNLQEDAFVLAHRIACKLANGDSLVWAADDGKVFVGDPERADELPTHWIAGLFRLGQNTTDIADDITFIRAARMKDFILD
jgi:hypothetical protein